MKKLQSNNGFGNCMPPTLENLAIYFSQKGLPVKAAEGFYRYHKARKWKTQAGNPVRNWKTLANNWIWSHQQANKPVTLEIKLKLQLPFPFQSNRNV